MVDSCSGELLICDQRGVNVNDWGHYQAESKQNQSIKDTGVSKPTICYIPKNKENWEQKDAQNSGN